MRNQLERNESYLGFTDRRSALQKSRVEKILDKKLRYEGVVMTRKDAMLYYLRDGKTPEVEEVEQNGKMKNLYCLSWDNLYIEITKTEYDFCMYLICNDLVSESRVDEYISNETNERKIRIEEQRKAEEAARKEREEKEQKLEDFRLWLRSEAKHYKEAGIHEDWQKIQERIFVSIYGDFSYPIRAFELLVCIDNIDKPLCKEELKARLHRDNEASRKTFFYVTGLRLPNTNKETMEFLDKVKKSDYTGTIEYKERKKPEESEVEMKTFYILAKDENGENTYKEVAGELFVKSDVDFFIHRTSDGGYAISSAECGLKIASEKSKSAAIKSMNEAIRKFGMNHIKEKINQAVKVFGKSPYYQYA